jgi:uncharacterized membrane protein YoaK (UPF0700 family)
MLVTIGPDRPEIADRHLAWSLAGIAGALNTAGFYTVGLYSSNMTGNVSALADHLGLADLGPAAIYLTLIATFVAGAALSAMLINIGNRHKIAGIYAYSILAEALIVSVLACADLWWPAEGRGRLLAYELSFAMGLQNAIVTRLSDARVRTTHVTGMLTDIGIEFGNLLWLRLAGGQSPDSQRIRNNLRLHGWTVLSFLFGGIVGVIGYRRFGAYLLFVIAAALWTISLRAIVAARTPPAGRSAMTPPVPLQEDLRP